MTVSRTLPLIRAASIAPMRRWLSENRINPEPLLGRAALGWVPDDRPLLPIPLRGAVRFLVEIARGAGPDAPLRIARDRGIHEIGPIGLLGLSGPTVRAGLHRLARQMPRHCTHEIFTVEDRNGFVRVGDGWAMNIGDDEARHHVQQYVAALVEGICRASGASSDCLARVSMVPHPDAGLAHLRGWLGDRLVTLRARPLQVDIPDTIADRAAAAQPPPNDGLQFGADWRPIRAGATLSDSISVLVASMLPFTPPSIDLISNAAGVSPRTLRRRLKDEGTSLSNMVDRTRARIAVSRLRDQSVQGLAELARELGYAHQAALSRSVRRWTGASPTEVRTGAARALRPEATPKLIREP